MDLLYAQVKHALFGIGEIIEIKDSYVMVSFPAKTIKFVYPYAFVTFIQAIDDDIQTHIIKIIKENPSSDSELQLREYIRQLIERLASCVNESIQKKYIKFIDTEKIRFTNTKSYRQQMRKNTSKTHISDYSAKLDYWVPVSNFRTNNDPHITYSSYDDSKKVFNLDAEIEGFSPSMTEEEFYKEKTKELFEILSPNDIIQMLQAYINNPHTWEDKSNYIRFCYNHIDDYRTLERQLLQEFYKYCG